MFFKKFKFKFNTFQVSDSLVFMEGDPVYILQSRKLSSKQETFDHHFKEILQMSASTMFYCSDENGGNQ